MSDPILDEIEHVRRTTELTGPVRLVVELASQAYLDAHVPATRDKPLARPDEAAAWLAGDGRAIYMALGTHREARAREQGERVG